MTKIHVVAQFSNLTSESILQAYSSLESAQERFKQIVLKDFKNEDYTIDLTTNTEEDALRNWSFYCENDGTGTDWTTEIRTLEVDEK